MNLQAVEAVYQAFQGNRPMLPRFELWGLSEGERQMLMREPLHTLNAVVLNSYLSEPDGFQDEHLLYFLPRMLELMSEGQLEEWRFWLMIEKVRPLLSPVQAEALHGFLGAWWVSALGEADHLWTLLDLLEHSQDQETWLRIWRKHPAPHASLNLAQAIRWELHLSRSPRFPVLDMWLRDPATERQLEFAFFADPDALNATEISEALTLWRGHVLGLWGAES